MSARADKAEAQLDEERRGFAQLQTALVSAHNEHLGELRATIDLMRAEMNGMEEGLEGVGASSQERADGLRLGAEAANREAARCRRQLSEVRRELALKEAEVALLSQSLDARDDSSSRWSMRRRALVAAHAMSVAAPTRRRRRRCCRRRKAGRAAARLEEERGCAAAAADEHSIVTPRLAARVAGICGGADVDANGGGGSPCGDEPSQKGGSSSSPGRGRMLVRSESIEIGRRRGLVRQSPRPVAKEVAPKAGLAAPLPPPPLEVGEEGEGAGEGPPPQDLDGRLRQARVFASFPHSSALCSCACDASSQQARGHRRSQ